MKTKIRVITGLAAATCVIATSAQTVWRCGDTYTQQPCAGGREVDVQDARTAGDRAANRDAVVRDEKLANTLQQVREHAESRPASAYIPPPALEPLPSTAPDGKIVQTKGPNKPKKKTSKKSKASATDSAAVTTPATNAIGLPAVAPAPAPRSATKSKTKKRAS